MIYKIPIKFVRAIELKDNGISSHYANDLFSVSSGLSNINLLKRHPEEVEKSMRQLEKGLQELVTYRTSLAYQVYLHNFREAEKVELDKLMEVIFNETDALRLDNLTCQLRGIGLASIVEGKSVISLEEVDSLQKECREVIKSGKYIPEKWTAEI